MTIEIPYLHNRPNKRWISALLLGCSMFVLTLFCLELIVVSGKISPLWFPTAAMTVVVFRCPSRQLPLYLAACVLGTACANAIIIGPALSNIKFALLNLLQAGLGGILLRALLDRRAPLSSLHDWARLVLSVGIVTPVIGGLMALWVLQVSGHASFPFFYTWVISEIIGMLVLGPMLLLLPWPVRRTQLRELRLTEFFLTLAVTLVASYLALRYLPWPFTFIVVIL
ncbi:MAG TPA: diguanylate cyclase, partial [Pantoea sp.]|nr:diguanylate cyclase [Pantoea sp.]